MSDFEARITVESAGRSIKRQVLAALSGTDFTNAKQTIGTSEEAIAAGDVAAGGYILVKNLATANFVKLRPGSGATDLVRLDPGDVAFFKVDNSATLYAISDTSTSLIEYWWWDE